MKESLKNSENWKTAPCQCVRRFTVYCFSAVRNTEVGQQNKHYRNVLLFWEFSHINAPIFMV